MSAPQHTPGPWFYRTCRAATYHDFTVLQGFPDDGCNKVIADVCERGVEHEEGEAIARLIAAAPDLLRELIDLRRRFHNACRSTGSDEEFVLGSTPGADAAIAKAAT